MGRAETLGPLSVCVCGDAVWTASHPHGTRTVGQTRRAFNACGASPPCTPQTLGALSWLQCLSVPTEVQSPLDTPVHGSLTSAPTRPDPRTPSTWRKVTSLPTWPPTPPAWACSCPNQAPWAFRPPGHRHSPQDISRGARMRSQHVTAGDSGKGQMASAHVTTVSGHDKCLPYALSFK